jgi:hypothetical protein
MALESIIIIGITDLGCIKNEMRLTEPGAQTPAYSACPDNVRRAPTTAHVESRCGAVVLRPRFHTSLIEPEVPPLSQTIDPLFGLD